MHSVYVFPKSRSQEKTCYKYLATFYKPDPGIGTTSRLSAFREGPAFYIFSIFSPCIPDGSSIAFGARKPSPPLQGRRPWVWGSLPEVPSVGVARPGGAEEGSPRPRGAHARIQSQQSFP